MKANKYRYAYSARDAANIAQKALESGYRVVGVEAEWGNTTLKDVFENVSACLSHHGENADALPPSQRWDLYNNFCENTCFIFSHFDLDSIFGCWILEGRIPDNCETREITEHIAWCDIRGSHRAHEDYENYITWGALISELNSMLNLLKRKKKRDHEIINELYKYFDSLLKRKNHTDKTKDYLKFNELAYNAMDKTLSVPNKLHVFMSYANFLDRYFIEYNDFISISEINIQYDTKKKRVSIGTRTDEIAKKYFGEKGVIEILQKYFGSEAGGRPSVGGSPKNQEISFTSFIKFVREIKKIIEGFDL